MDILKDRNQTIEILYLIKELIIRINNGEKLEDTTIAELTTAIEKFENNS